MVIIKIVVAAAAAAGLAGVFVPASLGEPDRAAPIQAQPAQQRPLIDFDRIGHAFR